MIAIIYEKICKIAYHIVKVLYYIFIIVIAIAFGAFLLFVLPIEVIKELRNVSIFEAIKSYLLFVCALTPIVGFFIAARKGSEIIKHEKMIRTLLVMDITPCKIWFAFYRRNKKGTVCLAKGEWEPQDIENAVDHDCNIIDPTTLAVLYHNLIKSSGAEVRRIYEHECKRAAVRIHTSDVSEKQKQRIEKMLSLLCYTMFSVEEVGNTVQQYLSTDEVDTRYGDWTKG